jgi:hypothetical protein
LGAWGYTNNGENWANRRFAACLESIEPGGSTRCVERHSKDFPIAAAELRQHAALNAFVLPLFGWLVYGLLGIVR